MGRAHRYDGLCCRLLANVSISTHAFKGTPCWDWTGKTVLDSKGKLGYPVFTKRIKGRVKNRRAHRESLKLFGGIKFRKGHEANHLCGRTICINPLHLERVTRTRNEHYKRYFTELVQYDEPPQPDPFEGIGTEVEVEEGVVPF